MSNNFKIVVTGGSGRFGKILKKKVNLDYFFPKKNQLDILKLNSIIKYLKKIKPKYLIHLAGLSRPLNIHEKNIERSINLNIVGTANVTIDGDSSETIDGAATFVLSTQYEAVTCVANATGTVDGWYII